MFSIFIVLWCILVRRSSASAMSLKVRRAWNGATGMLQHRDMSEASSASSESLLADTPESIIEWCVKNSLFARFLRKMENPTYPMDFWTPAPIAWVIEDVSSANRGRKKFVYLVVMSSFALLCRALQLDRAVCKDKRIPSSKLGEIFNVCVFFFPCCVSFFFFFFFFFFFLLTVVIGFFFL